MPLLTGLPSWWTFLLPNIHLARTQLGSQPRLLGLLVLLLECDERRRTRAHNAGRLRPERNHERRALDQPRQLRPLHQEIHHPTLRRCAHRQHRLLQHAERNILGRNLEPREALISLPNLQRIRTVSSRGQEWPFTHRQPASGRIHPTMVHLGFPTRAVQLHPV